MNNLVVYNCFLKIENLNLKLKDFVKSGRLNYIQMRTFMNKIFNFFRLSHKKNTLLFLNYSWLSGD